MNWAFFDYAFVKNQSEWCLLSLSFFSAMLAFALLTLEAKRSKVRVGFKTAPKGLEETLGELRKKLETQEKQIKAISDFLETADRRIKRSMQGAEIKRFNPFSGSGNGGNNSFASAILDENGDGIVFSTIYARDNTSVFGKPIKNFASQLGLTDEEKEVLEKVRTKLNAEK